MADRMPISWIGATLMEIWKQTDELRIAAAQIRWAVALQTHRPETTAAQACHQCSTGNDVLRTSVDGQKQASSGRVA
jgi:hypothetical protein